MNNQLTSNAEALKLFFTEDIYLIKSNDNHINIALNENPTIEIKIVDVVLPMPESVVYEENIIPLALVEEANIEIKPKLDFKFLGENKKNILILVNDHKNDVSTEQGRELLRKLVNAISITAKDFALLNYANYNTETFKNLNEFFACKLVLAFGVNSNQLGLTDMPLHELNLIGDIKLIFTTNLDDLATDNPSKSKLWASLQKIK